MANKAGHPFDVKVQLDEKELQELVSALTARRPRPWTKSGQQIKSASGRAVKLTITRVA